MIWSFYGIENKLVCRGEGYMKKFCESFREHAMKIINILKKKMTPLTNEQQELYEKTKICHICKIPFEHKYTNDKYNYKGKKPCHFTGKYSCAAHNICNLKCGIPKKVQVAFKNGSNCDLSQNS